MSTPQKYGKEQRQMFVDLVVSGTPQGKAYEQATGATPESSSVGACRWMALPDIQKEIQGKSTQKLIKAGKLAVDKLVMGLESITLEDSKNLSNPQVKLIEIGLKMSGVLERTIDLPAQDELYLDSLALQGLRVLGAQVGRETLKPQETVRNDEGVYVPK